MDYFQTSTEIERKQGSMVEETIGHLGDRVAGFLASEWMRESILQRYENQLAYCASPLFTF